MNLSNYIYEVWQFPAVLGKKEAHSVLIVEDSKMDFYLLEQILRSRKPSISLVHVEGVEEAKLVLQNKRNFDLVICDQFLPGNGTGITLWRYCQEKCPEIPFMMTSASNLRSFFETTAKGISPPFLLKPFSAGEAWNKIKPYLYYNHRNDVVPYEIVSSHPAAKIMGAISLAMIIFVSLLL
jgi:DNA-binding NtrC family response regulator